MNTTERREMSEEEHSMLKQMNGRQLAYKLALLLADRYDSGGISAERSQRSVLLDLFTSVNRYMDVPQFDGFYFADKLKDRAEEHMQQQRLPIPFKGDIIICNKRVICAVLLYLLKSHYLLEIERYKNLEEREGIGNHIDYSFESQIKDVQLLCAVYMSEVRLTNMEIEELVRQYSVEELYELVYRREESLMD